MQRIYVIYQYLDKFSGGLNFKNVGVSSIFAIFATCPGLEENVWHLIKNPKGIPWQPM
jgi:hypothetical protein